MTDRKEELKKLFIDDRVYFIHTAKCGGSSLRGQIFAHRLEVEVERYNNQEVQVDPRSNEYWLDLTKNNLGPNKKWMDYGVIGCHQNRPEISDHYKYIISIRNPIKRFVSAYYWKIQALETKAYGEDCPEELEALYSWGSANNLAEALYDDEGYLNEEADAFIEKRWTTYMNHIGMDLDYYLGHLLENIDPGQILGTIAAETMADDLIRVLGPLSNPKVTLGHDKKNDNYPREISRKAYNNLKSYLADDYECLRKLDSMGHITDEQRPYLFDDIGVKIKEDE